MTVDDHDDPTDNSERSEPGDADGWTACDDCAELTDRLEIDDLAMIAELTHPIRGMILRRLKEPRSVARLAEVMNVPVTRLYHHINRLVERGLIQVVATRQVAAVTERRYQVVARNFVLKRELFDALDSRDLALALGSLFDVAKLSLQREVESGGFRDVDEPEEHSMLSLGELHLSAERRHELMSRLHETVREFVSDLADDDPDATRISLFIAAFPDSS